MLSCTIPHPYPRLFDKGLVRYEEVIEQSPCVSLLVATISLEDRSDLALKQENAALVQLMVPACRDSCVYEDPGLVRDLGLAASLTLWCFWNRPPEVCKQAVKYTGGSRWP